MYPRFYRRRTMYETETNGIRTWANVTSHFDLVVLTILLLPVRYNVFMQTFCFFCIYVINRRADLTKDRQSLIAKLLPYDSILTSLDKIIILFLRTDFQIITNVLSFNIEM
jgi:hypothetical protein